MTEKAAPSREHWTRFFDDEFAKESERAFVMLATAMLEQALESLLKTTLVASQTEEDALFDGAYAPLASFSGKIDLAFRIGLIPAKWSRAFHLIGRIRNTFADDVKGCSFASPAVRNQTIELVRIMGVLQAFSGIRHLFGEGLRGEFQMIVSWLLGQLWSKVEIATPMSTSSDAEPASFDGKDA